MNQQTINKLISVFAAITLVFCTLGNAGIIPPAIAQTVAAVAASLIFITVKFKPLQNKNINEE